MNMKKELKDGYAVTYRSMATRFVKGDKLLNTLGGFENRLECYNEDLKDVGSYRKLDIVAIKDENGEEIWRRDENDKWVDLRKQHFNKRLSFSDVLEIVKNIKTFITPDGKHKKNTMNFRRNHGIVYMLFNATSTVPIYDLHYQKFLVDFPSYEDLKYISDNSPNYKPLNRIKYEIQSVKTYTSITDGLLNSKQVPEYSTIITKEQFDIIDMLANKGKDENFNDIYVVNDLKFKMVPYFGTID